MAKVNFVRLSVLFFLFSFVLASSQKLIFKYGNFSHNELELTFRVEKMCKKVVSFCHSNLACLLSPPLEFKKPKDRSNICPDSLLAALASLEYLMSHKVVNKCLLSDFFWLLEYIHTSLQTWKLPSAQKEGFFWLGGFMLDHFCFFLGRKFHGNFLAVLLYLLCPCVFLVGFYDMKDLPIGN